MGPGGGSQRAARAGDPAGPGPPAGGPGVEADGPADPEEAPPGGPASGWPQWWQNRTPSATTFPHCRQYIAPPARAADHDRPRRAHLAAVPV